MVQFAPSLDPALELRRRRVRGYSRLVRLLKLLLPALAAGLIMTLAIWSQIRLEDGRFRIETADLPAAAIDKLSMTNPRFEGLDDQNRPFTVTADEALQDKEDVDLIELVNPQADMTMENGNWVALSATAGQYWRKQQKLELAGEVSLFQDEGYEMHLEAVTIDFVAGSAESRNPVLGQGPFGELAAEGLQLFDGGGRILLLGKSRILFYPSDGAVLP